LFSRVPLVDHCVHYVVYVDYIELNAQMWATEIDNGNLTSLKITESKIL